MTTITIPENQQQASSSSVLGSLVRGTAKVAYAASLATAGVACMTAGVYLTYQTVIKTHDFYFADAENSKGFSDVPGYDKACHWITDQFSNISNETLSEDTYQFCNKFGKNGFSEHAWEEKPKAAAASVPILVGGALGGLTLNITGISLVGRSIEVLSSLV